MAFDIDKIRQKLEEVKKRSSGGGFFKPKEGPNQVRLVLDANGNWFFETGQHVIQVGKEQLYIACNEATEGSECFYCKLVEQLKKSKDKGEKEIAKKWRRQNKIHYNLLDRADNSALKPYSSGDSIFLGILKWAGNDEWGDIFDPDKGYDLVITKTSGKKGLTGAQAAMDVEYDVVPKKNPSPVGVDLEELDIHPLDASLVTLYTPDEQEQLMDGISEEDIMKARKENFKPVKGKEKEKVKDEPEVKEKESDGNSADVDSEIADALAALKNKHKK